jgi:hypothetical protein
MLSLLRLVAQVSKVPRYLDGKRVVEKDLFIIFNDDNRRDLYGYVTQVHPRFVAYDVFQYGKKDGSNSLFVKIGDSSALLTSGDVVKGRLHTRNSHLIKEDIKDAK